MLKTSAGSQAAITSCLPRDFFLPEKNTLSKPFHVSNCPQRFDLPHTCLERKTFANKAPRYKLGESTLRENQSSDNQTSNGRRSRRSHGRRPPCRVPARNENKPRENKTTMCDLLDNMVDTIIKFRPSTIYVPHKG